jgi:xanthosine utilization system XapX-like protein
VDDAARTELLLELRALRVVGVLGLFLGVQVVEVAEELVEAVVGRQHLVAVAEVVLAELAGHVALRP